MTIVSQPLPTPEWIFPTVTNYHEARVVGRKRSFDAEWGSEKQEQKDIRGSNKKARMAEPLKDASNTLKTTNDACVDTAGMLADARAPHEFLAGAGDWKFEPLCSDTAPIQNDIQPEQNAPSELVDVEKVIAILLQAMNSQSAEQEHDLSAKPAYRKLPTSPLSDSSNRLPFVRKIVGGSCRGRVDSGLQKWVLCKNHYDDIRSSHPYSRSSEWIEALHEMGWENLHPTYAPQSQQTFKTLNTFSQSWDDWIDIDERGDEDSRAELESGGEGDKIYLEGIHEDAWNSSVSNPQRTTPLMA